MSDQRRSEQQGRTVVESAYQPRDHALAFHARKERFAILVWHRRAGKTVACINDLIDKALQCPLAMPRYSYVAPFYKQAKDVAWNYLKLYAAPVIDKIMESELSVILKNGAQVRLYGADNPDSLRGVYNDGVILDEYGDMSPRLFGEVIAPTLADRKGWCVFIGTPKGPNHFHTLWKKAANDDRWFKSMLRSSVSGILDAEELEMLATLPGSDEDTFAQEFECDFNAAVRGAYYGKLLKKCEQDGLIGDFPWDPDRLVYTAWDIGFTDDTSIWFFQYDGKTIRVIDFFTVSGYSVDDVIAVLWERPYAYGECYLPHDAKNKSFQTGKSTMELMAAAQMKCRLVANLSVQDGIQAVRKTLPMIQFNAANDDVAEVGLNALRLYQREWDDKRRMFKEKPLHDWSSNPADAMRMLCLAMNPAAAKRAKRTEGRAPSTTKEDAPTGNVYNLDKLYAERAARDKNRRI